MPNNSLLEPNGSGENQIQKNLFRRQFRASLRGRPLQRGEVSLLSSEPVNLVARVEREGNRSPEMQAMFRRLVW